MPSVNFSYFTANVDRRYSETFRMHIIYGEEEYLMGVGTNNHYSLPGNLQTVLKNNNVKITDISNTTNNTPYGLPTWKSMFFDNYKDIYSAIICNTEDSNGYEFIDFGLPSGTLWATHNIGAENITDIGMYFKYTSSDGIYAKDIITQDSSEDNTNSDINSDATIDVIYDPSANTPIQIPDIPNIHMGSNWTLPTTDQLVELYKYTNQKSVNNYLSSGVNGIIFYKGTDMTNCLFLPAAGDIYDYSYDENKHDFRYHYFDNYSECEYLIKMNNEISKIWLGSMGEDKDNDTTDIEYVFTFEYAGSQKYVPIRPVFTNTK